jgi:hypothetical protein
MQLAALPPAWCIGSDTESVQRITECERRLLSPDRTITGVGDGGGEDGEYESQHEHGGVYGTSDGGMLVGVWKD